MTLVKKMKLFPSFNFWRKKQNKNKNKNSRQNVFGDILERKKVFLDSKIKKLKKSKNLDFSKRVSSWFWSKF